jgi:hypothetical protein
LAALRDGAPDNVDVNAVDPMVVLRCTQQLLLQFETVRRAPSAAIGKRELGDWYGTLIRMGNRHVLLFIPAHGRVCR